MVAESIAIYNAERSRIYVLKCKPRCCSPGVLGRPKVAELSAIGVNLWQDGSFTYLKLA